MKQFLLPLALVVAAVGGGAVGAGVMAAVDEGSSTTVTTTTPNRAVADTPSSVASLYKQVSPSVVEIQVEAQANSPFGTPQGGTGTGWMYDATHVVTNQHVIDGTNEVTVRFADGREVQASVVGSDPSTDVNQPTPMPGRRVSSAGFSTTRFSIATLATRKSVSAGFSSLSTVDTRHQSRTP